MRTRWWWYNVNWRESPGSLQEQPHIYLSASASIDRAEHQDIYYLQGDTRGGEAPGSESRHAHANTWLRNQSIIWHHDSWETRGDVSFIQNASQTREKCVQLTLNSQSTRLEISCYLHFPPKRTWFEYQCWTLMIKTDELRRCHLILTALR